MISIILGKLSKGKERSEDDDYASSKSTSPYASSGDEGAEGKDESSYDDEAELASAKDLLAAIDDNDPEAVVSALEAFVEACMKKNEEG